MGKGAWPAKPAAGLPIKTIYFTMAKKKKPLRFNYEAIQIRYFALTVVFSAMGLMILVRAFMMMHGGERQYWLAVSSRFKKDTLCLPAERGNIVAADGQVLATTLPDYKVFLDFTVMERTAALTQKYQLRRDRLLYLKLDSMCAGLHGVFPEVPAAAFKEKILNGRYRGEKYWCITPRPVTYLELCKLREIPFLSESKMLTAVQEVPIPNRKKPFGNLASKTVGDYRPQNADHQMSGLEAHFNEELSGRAGKGHKRKVLNQYLALVDFNAVNGCDVVTTIDVGMQDIVAKILRERVEELQAKVGLCILMEVKTGDVKAIVSMSDPNGEGYREYENRAISSYHSPGSVFKTASFMAAIEDGKLTIDNTVDVKDGRHYFGKFCMKDSHLCFPSVLTVAGVIENSSNVGTAILIDRFYHDHPEKFVEALYRTGINTDLGLPVSFYKKPNIRLPKTNSRGQWLNWSVTALPCMSIGYETQISPIQTLAFYNGIANGGVMVKPRFVTELRRGDIVEQKFPVAYVHPNRKDHMMCSPSTLKQIQTCLGRVVQRNKGTGKVAYSKKFRIAGKTGTAQIWSNKGKTGEFFATFVGYFPADKPLYSMIVCMEGPAFYGGPACGPVFKRVAEAIWAQNVRADIEQACDTTALRNAPPAIKGGNLGAIRHILDNLGIEFFGQFDNSMLAWGGNVAESGKRLTLSPDNMAKGRMPNVQGYGLRDALYRLERMGLKVKAHGSGTVRQQSIAPGSAIRYGQTVTLTLSTGTEKKTKGVPKAPVPKPDGKIQEKAEAVPGKQQAAQDMAAKLPQKRQQQKQQTTTEQKKS